MPLNGVDTLVLYAPVCDVDMSDPLVHEDRQAEASRCGNDNVKREKYLAWTSSQEARKIRLYACSLAER